ncbi:hypothetical protein B0J13DRAFT_647001 [Dactylonectria estremocensis]|uniref:Prion-inhibition and propagation HeLo domain-containing protein n=1 Tax=Dactylonectria estremocensis TaxID=1079267 RepID=A0A9P9DTF7_9HYPO|nr:hypothetical protein B0J13DRAFT_647001 [Dactylonectria estremocensis]
MAGLEVPGFVIGAVSLASLFKTCLECVEYIEAGKDMSKDLCISFTLLDLQKCRLQLFGDKSGIFEPECNPCGSNDFREKYRTFIKSLSDRVTAENITDIEAYADSVTEKQKGTNFFIKTRWAVHDRSKFKEPVEVVTRLIDALTIFTGEEKSIKNEIIWEIRQMRDLVPLERIERACRRLDHALSTVASGVIEVISNAESRGLNEEELGIEIGRRAVVSGDSDSEDDEPAKTKDTIAPSPTPKPGHGPSSKEANTQPDSNTEIAKKGTPSDGIARVFLIAHGSDGMDSMASQPFVTEGELPSFNEPEYNPRRGLLSAIRLAEVCQPILYNRDVWYGQKYCYVAPTSSHIELSIAISGKSQQPPIIRIDNRLLWKNKDAVLASLETASEVLGECELNAHSTHGPRLSHSGQLWPPLLRYLDTKYLDNLLSIAEDKEAGTTGSSGDAQAFGLHSIFAMHKDGGTYCYGDIIVIADRGRIQELLGSPVVQVDCSVRVESITQLHRLPRDAKEALDDSEPYLAWLHLSLSHMGSRLHLGYQCTTPKVV